MMLRPISPAEAVRTRDLRASGLTRHVANGRGWTGPTWGVRMPPDAPSDLASRCRALLLALPPHAVMTHLTAAALRDWWLPVGMVDVPTIVSTDDEAPHHDRRGVYVRRCRVPEGHRTVVDGVRIASAAWTIAELAEHISLIDLVAVIDCARHRGEVSLPELWAVCVKGRRGVRTLRQAIRLSDGRSESYWETVLRLLHVLCGFEKVRPQGVVRHEGRIIAHGDLLLEGTNRLHEYDGGDHRLPEVQDVDLDRDRALVRAGWVRLAYTSRVIVADPQQIIRDASEAFGLAYDPSSLAPWWYEMQRSSLSDLGRRRLYGRLRRFDRRTSPRSTRRAAQNTGLID